MLIHFQSDFSSFVSRINQVQSQVKETTQTLKSTKSHPDANPRIMYLRQSNPAKEKGPQVLDKRNGKRIIRIIRKKEEKRREEGE